MREILSLSQMHTHTCTHTFQKNGRMIVQTVSPMLHRCVRWENPKGDPQWVMPCIILFPWVCAESWDLVLTTALSEVRASRSHGWLHCMALSWWGYSNRAEKDCPADFEAAAAKGGKCPWGGPRGRGLWRPPEAEELSHTPARSCIWPHNVWD